jgi:hypothetical protein
MTFKENLIMNTWNSKFRFDIWPIFLHIDQLFFHKIFLIFTNKMQLRASLMVDQKCYSKVANEVIGRWT